MTNTPQYLEAQLKMPLTTIPLRTTIVDVPGGGRILYSPGSTLTDEQLASAGAVTDVVCGNLLHLDGAKPAARAFPEARLWGPRGSREKLPDVKWGGLLGDDPWPYEDDLPFVTLDGMPRFEEAVLFDRASRTLLVSDLVFNIEDPRGLGAYLVLGLFGTHGRFAVSRLFKSFLKDRAAARASLERVLAWNFDAISMAHGAVKQAGPDVLRAALVERGMI